MTSKSANSRNSAAMSDKTRGRLRPRLRGCWPVVLAIITCVLAIPGPIRAQWTTNGNNINNTNSGNVGVGTTNPTYGKLQVNKTIRIDDDSGSTIGSDTLAAAPNLYLGTSGGGGMFQFNGNGGIDLWQYNSSGWGRKVTFAKTGYVGIGTASPAYTLDVVGSINVSGNINAKYQDVAEWVESSQELQAGTVVVLDSTKSNQVVASTQSYDTLVAGVVSLRPGLALGEAGKNKILVATTGRVRVKVDATSGPIQIGDLLVTGDKEGVAMKSKPVDIGGVRLHRPGTLIGKALEPLEKGSAEILVLLSLQ